MKKALKVIAISAGLISTAAALLLSCLYLEDFFKFFHVFRPGKIFKKLLGIGRR